MGAGYGLASPGIFRTPYPLNRFGYGGSETDPVASLIGNALGSLQSVRAQGLNEADRRQQIADVQQRETDEKNWRDLQTARQLASEGLSTQAPAPDTTGAVGGLPFSGVKAAAPVASVGSQNLYATGPRPADEHQRQVHMAVGRALATQMGMGDVDDNTAEGIGAAPQSFVGLQKIDNPPPARTALPKGPTPKERTDAGNGMAAQSADTDLTTMEHSHPEVLPEVARWMTTPAIGRLIPGSPGTATADILRQARSAGLSDNAQTYLKRMFDFASIAGPARYGRRFGSEIALNQIWSDFGAGQMGASQGGISATQTNRHNAVRAMRTAAGEPAWKAAQSVPTDVPQTGPKNQRATYSPDNPFAPHQ